MKRNFIRSSNLYSVGYDAIQLLLEIEFISGSVYQYYDVPSIIYEQLLRASSAGRYFNQKVAHSFKYRNIQSTSYFGQSTQIFNPVLSLDIEHLYRKLALKFHPDRIAGFEDVMKQVNILYQERNFHGLQSVALKYNIQ